MDRRILILIIFFIYVNRDLNRSESSTSGPNLIDYFFININYLIFNDRNVSGFK